MNSWLRLIPVGLLGATLATACVIVQTDDELDDDEETGGSSGTGGSKGGASGSGGQSGAKSQGGSGGTASGGAPGGGAPSGGMGGDTSSTGGVQCDDPEEGPLSERFPMCEFMDAGPCEMCLTEFCCLEVRDCYGTEPDNVCGYANDGEGEFACVRECLEMYSAEGDIPDQMVVNDCIASCQASECLLPGEYTLPLVQCMTTNCDSQCYLPEEM